MVSAPVSAVLYLTQVFVLQGEFVFLLIAFVFGIVLYLIQKYVYNNISPRFSSGVFIDMVPRLFIPL